MSHNSSSSDSESISTTTHPNSSSLQIEQQIAHAFVTGHVLDTPVLMKAVMEFQQENVRLRKENANLETRIVDLKLQLKADKNSNSTASIEQEMKTDIGRAAKFFHVFMSPSVSAEAFMVDKPTFLYDSPERYDEGQQKYGIVAELHHTIPEKYLIYLRKHESLVKEFISCLSTGRSSALERLRSNASSVFNPPEGTSNPGMLQLDQALFATGVNRSQNERVCQLLGIINGGKTFSVLPPILFSRETPNIMSRLFFHPSLFRLARLIVYGPTSLAQKDPKKLTMRANNTYFHPVTKLPPTATPGFISWMCMMVCYILSDDTEFNFSGVGNITGTKYFENYDIYKQTLIEGLARGKFLDLITTWNREVFPRSQVSEVIPDSQPASFSGGNMGGKQGVDINNVANILKQLSFEENASEKEEGNKSDGHRDSDDHKSDDTSDNNNIYEPEPPISMESPIPSSSFITEPNVTTNTAISSQTPVQETQLMGDSEVIQHDQSSGSKAPLTDKKTSRALVQKGQSRSSSRRPPKALADPLSLPPPTDDVPPPKPKRATRGRAATTKGKTSHGA